MASKITIPDLKKIRVTDPLFSHYADMVAKKMIPVQWEILNGKQGQSRCFCIDNFRIAGGTLQGEHRGVVFGDTDAYKWLEAVAYCANNGETEYISQAWSLALSGADDEKLAAAFEEVFDEKTTGADFPTLTATLTIPCVQTSDGWKISSSADSSEDLSAQLLDILTSNIYGALEDFGAGLLG